MLAADERKKAIEKKKMELKELEKNLREREKILSQKRLIEIGKLSAKAKIDNVESDVLFGAFLDIANKLHEKDSIKKWKELANQIRTNEKKNCIAVSFKNQPSSEAKEQLKKLNFRWNKFRNEFCGMGDKSMVSSIMKDYECKIEVIE
jgi:hypothetical protein